MNLLSSLKQHASLNLWLPFLTSLLFNKIMRKSQGHCSLQQIDGGVTNFKESKWWKSTILLCGCNKYEWKTQESDLLQTLKFYNANLAPPFPTIYGWICYLGNQWLWASCDLNPQSLWIWQNDLVSFFKTSFWVFAHPHAIQSLLTKIHM